MSDKTKHLINIPGQNEGTTAPHFASGLIEIAGQPAATAPALIDPLAELRQHVVDSLKEDLRSERDKRFTVEAALDRAQSRIKELEKQLGIVEPEEAPAPLINIPAAE